MSKKLDRQSPRAFKRTMQKQKTKFVNNKKANHKKHTILPVKDELYLRGLMIEPNCTMWW